MVASDKMSAILETEDPDRPPHVPLGFFAGRPTFRDDRGVETLLIDWEKTERAELFSSIETSEKFSSEQLSLIETRVWSSL